MYIHMQIGVHDYFSYNGPHTSLPVNAGTWVQYETLMIPDTSDGSPLDPADPPTPPPYPCSSPSAPMCGNGTMKFWVNGTLMMDCQNCNLTNADGILNKSSVLHIGDFLTSFDSSFTNRCTTWSSSGGGTCPGSQPGSGAPKPMYRYLDDIIILTR
jgi:hypothetical protein